MKPSTLFSMAVMMVCIPAYADTSPQFHKCMDSVDPSTFKNSQWMRCIAEEQSRLDDRMKKEFLNVYKYATEQQRKELIEGQRNFMSNRERICKEESKDRAPTGEINYGLCKMEHTDKWINVLRSLEPN